jgi:hypothetical protein
MSILSLQKQSQNTDFPNLRPSLDLRFALAKKLDPRITFTRGSTGTYFGPDGLMKTAIANEPRFDHDPITGQSLGLLIEESRQNLLTYSADISNAAWGKTNSSIGPTTTAPDGTSTAYKLIENSTNGFHFISQSPGTISGTYTVSCFVKAAERYKGYLQLLGSGGNAAVFFDLKTGTITGGAGTNTITPYPNGWYRVTSTLTFTSSVGAVCYFVINRDDGIAIYSGDNNSGIYVWGLQVEVGSSPTSYIPTTASTVTRSADLASMEGTNFSSWYNQNEGTIYMELDKLYSGNFDAYRHPYRIDSGSNADQITAYTLPGATTITNYGISTGGRSVNDYQQINIGSSPIRYKLGQSVNSKYFFFTTSTGRVPPQLPSSSSPNTHNLSLATNMTRLYIGSSAGGNHMNSHIGRFTYYPIQITNQQLINLTS